MTTPSIPPAGPPAGWYPSQSDPTTQVYWDGSAWTGQTRPVATPASVTGPPGTKPGTGAYTGLFHDGKKWLNADGSRANIKGIRPASPPGGSGRSAGRTIGGIAALIVAGLAGMQALSWLQGFLELDQQGNGFAGILVPMGLAAGAVAAGFGIWGVMLLSKK